MKSDMLRKGPRARTCFTIWRASSRICSGSSMRTSPQAAVMPLPLRKEDEPCSML